MAAVEAHSFRRNQKLSRYIYRRRLGYELPIFYSESKFSNILRHAPKTPTPAPPTRMSTPSLSHHAKISQVCRPSFLTQPEHKASAQWCALPRRCRQSLCSSRRRASCVDWKYVEGWVQQSQLLPTIVSIFMQLAYHSSLQGWVEDEAVLWAFDWRSKSKQVLLDDKHENVYLSSSIRFKPENKNSPLLWTASWFAPLTSLKISLYELPEVSELEGSIVAKKTLAFGGARAINRASFWVFVP